ncbi:hypothetical protein [Streptomyces sp. L2]|uniref:hypothetical protein n=1 Tax=Streptomyces sp. L2 TaxID=2162665 RepID=UPI0013E912C6|nr:hypothetical protein [Streptomyces sp. L2]
MKRRDALLAGLAADRDGEDTAVGRLRQCMIALARMNEGHRQETNSLLMAWVRAGRPLLEDPYLADLFATIAAAGLESGEFRTGVGAERIGHSLRDLYLGALYRWCGSPERGEKEAAAPDGLTTELLDILDLTLNGIRAA